MSDKTAVVSYMWNQEGDKPASDHIFSNRHISVGWERRIRLVPHHPPGYLNELVDFRSWRGPIFNTEYILDYTISDRNFRVWGRPSCGPCHLSKQHKTGKLHLPHSGGHGIGNGQLFARTGTVWTFMYRLCIVTVSFALHFTIIQDFNHHSLK